MSKKNITNNESPKKIRDIKTKALGLYSLVVALAELSTVYILVTQDSKGLYALAVVLGVDAAQRLTSKFIK